jgi:hypothetical protein
MVGFGESNLVVAPFGLHSGLRQRGKAFGLAVWPKAEALGYPIVPGIAPMGICADGGRLRVVLDEFWGWF